MSTGRGEALDRLARRAVAGAGHDERTGARVVDHGDSVEDIALCLRTLRQAPAVHYLAQYTFSDPDYTVDTLATGAPGRSERLLSSVNAFGCDLFDYMVRLGKALAAARTGGLIRCFLVADRTAVHWNEITEVQHLVALSFCDPAIPPTARPAVYRDDDRAVAELANALRGRLSQHPRDYGGWLAGSSVLPIQRRGTPTAPSEGTAEPAVRGSDLPAALCRDALTAANLHYAAVFTRGEPVAAADVLHHPKLRRFASGTVPAQRRQFYDEFGTLLGGFARDLSATIFPVTRGPASYLVLDVERGAVYYHWVRPDTYVIAVTLDQTKVATAELDVAELAKQLGA
jgi:hypothetical protein